MKAKNRQAGISASTAAAIIWPQSTENLETKVRSPTAKVIFSSLLISIRANSSSDQAAVKTKPSVAAMPGRVKGRITRRSAPSRVQPSIIADSSSSFGMASRKDCIRKVANGTLKAV